jgi:hypothetical protein
MRRQHRTRTGGLTVMSNYAAHAQILAGFLPPERALLQACRHGERAAPML